MTHGWNRKTGTAADSMTAAGKQVSRCGKSYANLVAQYGEPVRPVKEVPAVGMTVSPKDETIIDFGQNLGGGSARKSETACRNKNGIRSF